MKLFKNPLFYLCLVLVLVAGMMVIDFVRAQASPRSWEEPTQAFPGGITSNPIDESEGDQFKIKTESNKGRIGAYEIGIPDGAGNLKSYPKMTEDSLCLDSDEGSKCIQKWDQISGAWTSGDGGLYYNGGDVGIGTTDPQYELDVDGYMNVNRLFVNEGVKMGVSDGRFWMAPKERNNWNYSKEITYNPDNLGGIWEIEGGVNIKGNIYQNDSEFEGGGESSTITNNSIRIVQDEVDGFSRAVSSCPSGTVLIGGSCDQGPGSGEVIITRSEPRGGSWICESRKIGSGHLGVRATAICYDSSPPDPVYPVESPPISFDLSIGSCPESGILVSVVFNWSSVDNAQFYDVERQIEIEDDVWGGVLSIDDLLNSKYSESVNADQNYMRVVRYRVRACNEAGCSDWTAWSSGSLPICELDKPDLR